MSIGVVSTNIFYVILNWQNTTWACVSMILMMLAVDMGIALLYMESFGIGIKKPDATPEKKFKRL